VQKFYFCQAEVELPNSCNYLCKRSIEGFAKVVSLEEIRVNDGNLSIPLYAHSVSMRGKAVGEGKGEYAADGLWEAVQAWEGSSDKLNEAISGLLKTLT
jgi:type I restriction-modification system DNA methylase subunit